MGLTVVTRIYAYDHPYAPSHRELILRPKPYSTSLNCFRGSVLGARHRWLPPAKKPENTSIEPAQKAPCHRSPLRRGSRTLVGARLAAMFISHEPRSCRGLANFSEFGVSSREFDKQAIQVIVSLSGRHRMKLHGFSPTLLRLHRCAVCRRAAQQVKSHKFGYVHPHQSTVKITHVPRRRGVTPLMFATRFSPVSIRRARALTDALWLIEDGRW